MMILGIYMAIGAALYLLAVLSVEPLRKFGKKRNVSSDNLDKASNMLNQITSEGAIGVIITIITVITLWPVGIMLGISLILNDNDK